MANMRKDVARDESGAGEEVERARQQQHTGNHPGDDEHKRPYGSDAFGGTRTGAENVEPSAGKKR